MTSATSARFARPARLIRATVICVFALSGLAFTADAQAADSISVKGLTATVTTSTSPILSESRRVHATLTLKAGRRRFAVGINSKSPQSTSFVGGRLQKSGALLRFARVTKIVGRHEWMWQGSRGGNPDCERSLRGGNGSMVSDFSLGIVVPARRTVRIELEFDVTGQLPWIDSSYAPGFILRPVKIYRSSAEEERGPSRPRDSITLRRNKYLSAVAPMLQLPIAARIDFTTEPAPNGSSGSGSPLLRSQTGAPVNIVGSLLPPRSGATVNLNYRRLEYPNPPVTAPIGSATTAADGSFRLDGWVPPAGERYEYEVFAEYPQQPGDLMTDATCPLSVVVN